MVYTYNPSFFLRGGDQENHGSRPIRAKKRFLKSPSLSVLGHGWCTPIIPAIQERTNGKTVAQAGLDIRVRLYLKVVGSVSSGRTPSKHEVLSSNTSTTKKNFFNMNS
jgi:hypothetical protein